MRTVAVLAMLVLSCVALGPELKPAAGENPETKVWDLTSYMKGTASQIRAGLNREIIRLTHAIARSEGDLNESQRDLAADTRACLGRAHARNDCKALAAEMVEAKAALDQAREVGSTAERMAASSRYNRARLAIERIEKTALADDRRLLADQRRINDFTERLSEQQRSMRKAGEWKSKVCDATRASLKLDWPLAPGRKGFPEDVVVKDATADGFLCEYEAFETVSEGESREGIATYHGRIHKVTMVVTGVNAKDMKAGDHLSLDRTFEVAAAKVMGDELVYVIRPAPQAADVLWQRMTAPISDAEFAAADAAK